MDIAHVLKDILNVLNSISISMEFRTELHVDPSGLDLDYSSGMMMMGSCFAENIGHMLRDHRLPVKFNSHGILFNPISIRSAMDDILIEVKNTPKKTCVTSMGSI
jgi:hypothetical protein